MDRTDSLMDPEGFLGALGDVLPAVCPIAPSTTGCSLCSANMVALAPIMGDRIQNIAWLVCSFKNNR